VELNVRVLKQLVSHAEYQFGDRVPGKEYHEKKNGKCIQNWGLEIKMLIPIYSRLATLYGRDELLNMIDRDNLTFPLHEKMLNVLRPWSVCRS
jgi:hypothetical protein